MRFVVLAGVPFEVEQEFSKILSIRALGNRSIKFIWSPLKRRSQEYRYDSLYERTLITKLYKAIRADIGSSNIHDKKNISALLLYIEHDSESTAQLRDAFHPLVLASLCRVERVQSMPITPNSKSHLANMIAEEFSRKLQDGGKVLSAIEREMENNESRTPLLLPLRNFKSKTYRDQLHLASRLENYDVSDANQALHAKCRDLSSSLDWSSSKGRKGLSFHDDRRLAFNSPGRNRHGIAWLKSLNEIGAHMPTCILGARIRLGAAFDPKFHYDVVALKKNLPKQFIGCHNQNHSIVKKLTHINIAPNDAVRDGSK